MPDIFRQFQRLRCMLHAAKPHTAIVRSSPVTYIVIHGAMLETAVVFLQPPLLHPLSQNRKIFPYIFLKSLFICLRRDTGKKQQMFNHIPSFDFILRKQDAVCNGEKVFLALILLNLFQCRISIRPIGSAGMQASQITSSAAAQRQRTFQSAFTEFRVGTRGIFFQKTPHGFLYITLLF